MDERQRNSGLPVPPAAGQARACPADGSDKRSAVSLLPPSPDVRPHLPLLASGVLAGDRDLSRGDAFDYWKDLYSTPSMTSSLSDNVELDGRRRAALILRGKIGPAAASWFRERLDEAGLKPGDLILLSSPGGDLGQSVIMGEIIRARGLVTAVGTTDASGQIRPGSCASGLRVRLCRRHGAL